MYVRAFFVSALYFIPSTHHCVTMINYSWKSVYHSVSVYLFFNVVVLVVDNAFVTTAAVIVIFFIVWFDMCESERESVHSATRVCIVFVCVCDVQFVYLLFNSSQHWRFVFGNMKLSRQRSPFLFSLILFHHLNYSLPYCYLWVWTQPFAVFMQF